MNYNATKQKVSNRGAPPDDFLKELVGSGKQAADEIFAPDTAKQSLYVKKDEVFQLSKFRLLSDIPRTGRWQMATLLLLLLVIFLFADAKAFGEQSVITVTVPDDEAGNQLRQFSQPFQTQNPDLKIEWVQLPQDQLREKVVVDLMAGRPLDVVYLNPYDATLSAKHGFLKPLENIPSDYDLADVFKSLRDAFSYNGQLYALPFYGESSMLFYRKDLFAQKGLEMPEQPTYDDVIAFADALRGPGCDILVRGNPGWTGNMMYIATLLNTFGGDWFRKDKLTINTPAWHQAITLYRDLSTRYGDRCTGNNAGQNLELFAAEQATMLIDSTSIGKRLIDKTYSQVSDRVGFANSPVEWTSKGSNWLWSFGLAIPKNSRAPDAAMRFILWATSKEYVRLVSSNSGWTDALLGTRKSTYSEPNSTVAAQYAKVASHAIETGVLPYARWPQTAPLENFEGISDQLGKLFLKEVPSETDLRAELLTSLHGIEAQPTPKPPLSPTSLDPQVVTVLYATNRAEMPSDSANLKFPRFSRARGQSVTFGSSQVRVPECHTSGQIERPKLDLLHLFVFVITSKTENSAVDFILRDVRVLTKEEFVQEIRDSGVTSALIYVHGFATNFEDDLYRVAQLRWDTGYNGVPIAFSWPSDGEVGFIAYNHDRQLAEDSEDAFLEVLNLVKSSAQISRIYVVAHSMGNEIVLDAIDKARGSGKELALSEIVMAAPDVATEHFEDHGHVLTEAAKGVTVYASSTDTALITSEKYNGGLPRAGSITAKGPFVLPGVETIDISALGPNIFSLTFNHDLVMSTVPALDDLGRLLLTGDHPPNLRSPGMIRGYPEGSPIPKYWVLHR